MTSAARIEANRRNAKKSTGPKTPQGKQRSSRNNTRHGLASKGGVVLSHAERALLSRRRKAWHASLAPVGAREAALVEQMVFASVVLDRIERIDGEAWLHEHQTAIERFDQEQEQQLQAAIALLAEAPALAVVRLRASAPGGAWLLDRLEELRSVLAWDGTLSAEDAGQALRLLGRSPEARFPDPLTARLLGMIPGPAGSPAPDWGEMARLLDEQVERLRPRLAALLPGYLHARTTAPERAWLPAAVATLVIRHGGAWESRFHRALRRLDRLQCARRRAAARKNRALEANAAPTQTLSLPQPAPTPIPIAAHAAAACRSTPCPGFPAEQADTYHPAFQDRPDAPKPGPSRRQTEASPTGTAGIDPPPAQNNRAPEPNVVTTQTLATINVLPAPAPTAAHAASRPQAQRRPRVADRQAPGRRRARVRIGQTPPSRRKDRARTQQPIVANRNRVRTCARTAPNERARVSEQRPPRSAPEWMSRPLSPAARRTGQSRSIGRARMRDAPARASPPPRNTRFLTAVPLAAGRRRKAA